MANGLGSTHLPVVFDPFQSLLQGGQAAASSPKRIAILLIITLKPPGTNTQNEPTIADMIDSLSHIRKQGRMAITIASDETTYLCSLGQRDHCREQRPTLEIASLRVASKWKEMIPISNDINPQILRTT